MPFVVYGKTEIVIYYNLINLFLIIIKQQNLVVSTNGLSNNM